MRLDKFLVDCGVGSRSQVKNFLKKKQVTVNGQVETSPKTQIDENKDRIAYLDQELTHETFVYYLLNKPQGVISATEDPRHKTVLDLLDDTARHKQVFPVGRLDIDTIAEGKFHQVKRMVAACGKEVTELQRLSMGPLSLPNDLELGTWRRLTEEELEALTVFGIPLS